MFAKKLEFKALIGFVIFLVILFGCDQEKNDEFDKIASKQLQTVPNQFQDPTNPLNIGENHNYWLDEKISVWEKDEPEEWEDGIDRLKTFLNDVITRDIDISGDDKQLIIDVSEQIADSVDMEYQGDFNFREKWFSFDHDLYDELINKGFINNDEESLMEDAFDELLALPDDASDGEIQSFIANMENLLEDWHDNNFNTGNGEGFISAALITTSIETSNYWLEEDNYSDEKPGALIANDVTGAVVGGGMAIVEGVYDDGEVDWAKAGTMAAGGAVLGTAGGALGRAVQRWWRGE